MGGCLRMCTAGARAVIMAPPAEVFAAMAATLRISTRRVGTAILQSDGAKKALQMTFCLPAS